MNPTRAINLKTVMTRLRVTQSHADERRDTTSCDTVQRFKPGNHVSAVVDRLVTQKVNSIERPVIADRCGDSNYVIPWYVAPDQSLSIDFVQTGELDVTITQYLMTVGDADPKI